VLHVSLPTLFQYVGKRVDEMVEAGKVDVTLILNLSRIFRMCVKFSTGYIKNYNNKISTE
jgi:hypothetical protein